MYKGIRHILLMVDKNDKWLKTPNNQRMVEVLINSCDVILGSIYNYISQE